MSRIDISKFMNDVKKDNKEKIVVKTSNRTHL